MNTQLTTQVQEIVTKSGKVFELDITNIAALAERAKAITSVNDEGFEEVKKEMQKARKYTNEYFLNARSDFNRLAKGVIEVEKLILAEFVPDENRLIEMSKAEKARLLKEERLASLPAKRERITEAGITLTDDEVLALTDVDFELTFVRLVSEKAQADAEQARIDMENERIAIEKEKAELAEAQAKIERDKQEAIDREARAKKEEEDRIARLGQEEEARQQRLIDEEKARIARIQKEEDDRLAKIESDRIEAEEAEQARLADEAYQTFLKDNNFDEETDIVIDGVLYRKVAEYTN